MSLSRESIAVEAPVNPQQGSRRATLDAHLDLAGLGSALDRYRILEAGAQVGRARERIDRRIAQATHRQPRELAVVAIEQRDVRERREAIAVHLLRFGQGSQHAAEHAVVRDAAEL